ncbi:MAG: ABC transporter permease [Thermoanaerobaculia bacterium]|jgi:putative ABC transport system permease protein
MTFEEALLTALANLRAHKLRTTLTMLGMIFGVGAVIAMLSIGAGAERQALASIGSLGVRNVLIRTIPLDNQEKEEIRKKSLGVSTRDGEAIAEAVDGVEVVLPRVEVKVHRISSAGRKTEGKVQGVAWTSSRALPLVEGRALDALDERTHAQVCIIGPRIRNELFGYGTAIGRTVKVNDVWLEVVGVLGASPGSGSKVEGMPAMSTAREIYVPVTTAQRKFDRDPLDSPVDELVVRLRESVSPAAAAELMKTLLDRLHAGEKDYEIIVPEALLEQSRKTQRIFAIVMGSIAGISLLVGGIGIMNIMLASVLERTREIGIRRALGARPVDIRTQFVIEAFSISIAGGFVGIVTGVALARVVAASAGWPTVVTITSLVLSTGVSMLVGLASGIYPALRAAALDPIEALRYE